jgi:pyruvate dehydrogenase E2 component (dihydrolipoamide acetyltransferase)
MATDVILPALGMAQDSGKIVRWLKAEGEQVKQGEPLVEIETDKATVEIEAQVDGVLAHLTAEEGEDVPVGQVIATILAPGEIMQEGEARTSTQRSGHIASEASAAQREVGGFSAQKELAFDGGTPSGGAVHQKVVVASPLAARIAAAHSLDLSLVQTDGKRVQKTDVLAYLKSQNQNRGEPSPTGMMPASPKARRLAREQGKDLATIQGSGPEGAVLTADVLTAVAQTAFAAEEVSTKAALTQITSASSNEPSSLAMSTIWRIMAERTTQSWTSTPHFYLVREIRASQLIAWREHLMVQVSGRITYTDLLVKIVATALRKHPHLNATWEHGKITLQGDIHLGLAIAVEEGLVVPVIHQADRLNLSQVAQRREELVSRARAKKLRLQDISGGTFTISNLGMYEIDAFNAIINQPQAAILAVGRITERVVPVNGQPAVRPMMTLTLSCDHRVVDGAQGAQFLGSIANFIEEPQELLDNF